MQLLGLRVALTLATDNDVEWIMERCTDYQSQMLEYLYDLLDDEDRQQFVEHLGYCAPCQSALRQARQQRGVGAEAQFRPRRVRRALQRHDLAGLQVEHTQLLPRAERQQLAIRRKRWLRSTIDLQRKNGLGRLRLP